MRSRTPADFFEHCPRCHQRDTACICGLVKKVETRTRFLVMRHARETPLSSNTARIAALAMPELRIVEVGKENAPFDPAPLREPGTWLLYPGAEGRPPEGRPSQLVVLDGSWRLARRMFLHIEELRGLPILSLPPPEIAPQRLRKPPREDGMSTLEAISAAVKLLEGEEVARPLDELFEQMVDRVLAVRGRRHG